MVVCVEMDIKLWVRIIAPLLYSPALTPYVHLQQVHVQHPLLHF